MNYVRLFLLFAVITLASGCKLNMAANLHPFQDPPSEQQTCRPAMECEYRNSGDML